MSRLTDLIAHAKARDPTLGADLEAELRVLQGRRPFGLNFERHQPEAVELPGRAVRKGDKVRVLPPRGQTQRGNQRLWRVNRINSVDGERIAHLEHAGPADTVETQTVLVDDVVVVAEFRDPIYPGLRSTGQVERGGADEPFHTVINAENYHALQTLLYTHRGQVDCIYIDPPYATGKDDWIYNDRHVDADDLYRHSKWLAFMERRLLLARELLRDTGVIMVAIGDDQHHRLRMLLDQTFDESNFIANITWQGSGKNDSRFTSGGVDYMLIYANNASVLREANVRWSEPKQGVEILRRCAAEAWAQAEGDPSKATAEFRRLVRPHRSELEPAVYRYDQIDARGRVFQADNLTSPNPRANLRYTLTHPITGGTIPFPEKGWRYSRDTMDALIADDRILFGPDETTRPRYKRLLDEMESRVPYETFTLSRMPASNRLAGILGEKRFPYPKDHTVLMRWLGIVAGDDAMILDYFGGSGTTLEAVVRLNDMDGGSRRCVLVTNNEVGAKEERSLRRAGFRKGDPEWEAKGVYEYVTKPRVSTVVSGVRPDGSTYDDTVAANVEFFDLTYESPWRVARNRDFVVIAPLLWLRAGSRGRRIDTVPEQGWDVADTYGVLVNLDAAKDFTRAVSDTDGVGLVFVVTDDDRRFQMVAKSLPETVEVVRLYESYLRNFEINTGRR